jgi:hypothetical protein
MRPIRILLSATAAFALVVALAPPTPAAGPPPTATDVGVTASTIRIAVVADVDNPAEPGLHEANVDAVRAFATYVNAHGGLAGRKLAVDFYDSHLDPADTQDAIISACEHDFAMVGTGASFVNDITPLVSCPDQTGRATGLPDLSTFALDPGYACSPVSFQLEPSALDCSTANASPQRYVVQVGPAQYYARQHPGLHGVYVLSGDLASVKNAALPLVNAWTKAGIRQDGDGTDFVSSEAPRSALTPVVQGIASHQSTFVYAGVPVQLVAELRAEAQLQGVSSVKVWTCSFECYDPALFSSGAATVNGESITATTIPFEEATAVPAMATYLRAVGGVAHATGFGVQAWATGLLFRDVVNAIVHQSGPNGLTRSAFLTAARADHHFTADGILGSTDIGARRPSNCFLLLQATNGRFARVYPKTPGTFDCKASNTRTITLDLHS